MSDPYFDTGVCITRLCYDYQVHGNLVIGFDFDDTIFDYHKKGHEYTLMVALLKECRHLGFTMCMSTNERDPEKMIFKKEYCDHILGFYPDYTNESPLLQGGGKPFYSIVLDDRAGLGQAYEILHKTVALIKQNKEEKA